MNNHLDTMLAQHRELRTLAADYRRELDRAIPDLAALGKCRWTLARLISAHLAYETTHLYPAVQRIGPQPAALGDRMASEIGQLTAALGEHVRSWTVASIETDWARYRRASRQLIDTLCARMDREEAELYPLLGKAKAA
jgi:hypothetical protein